MIADVWQKYAADHRKFELCRLLLANGADIQHEDDCKR